MKQYILALGFISVISFSMTACKNNSDTEQEGTESTAPDTAPTSNPEAFTPESFDKLLKDNEIVVVDFKADWCGPCKVLGPILEKVHADYKDKVILQKVDIDKSQALAQQMGITGIPLVVKYVKGQKVNEILGVTSEENVRAFFEK
ncbi:MAG TPA: thioredoxin family protein [Edaphocola sp.]|nr:thioredoxin family protein [Edaphocola sp.]